MSQAEHSIDICSVRVHSYSFDEVVDIIVDHIVSNRSPEYVVTPNAHHIVTIQENSYFREIYESSFLSVPDGVPLLWAAKFLGTPLPTRVNGTDLFEKLCEVGAEKGLKIFLLGGRPGAAIAASDVLSKKYPKIQIAGHYCPPYGFETDKGELEKISQALQAASPDLVFVGLGAPKQEKWIYENYKDLDIPISVGIGVSFELVAGIVTRAPKIMQRLGLEWLFRLFMEPQRLWKRYVVGNTVFVYLVIKQKFGLL